ncbi:MAG: hypothetical protein LUF35_06285 [Lachnospiraceae bacterium]|nr:hypothetical protein [Lachnospiraceae bacterium]
MKRFAFLWMSFMIAFALPGAASAVQEVLTEPDTSTEREVSAEPDTSTEQELSTESEPVAKEYFSLNGQEYSFTPVLGDFLENGWNLGSVLETFGYSYSEGSYETEDAEEGEWVTYTEDPDSTITVTFNSGYELLGGENAVGAYLDQISVETGTEPAECPLARLGVNVGYVSSFILNGIELADADYACMEDAFGAPETVEENEVSVIFSYSLPEVSAQISFVYYGAAGDTEGQNELRDTHTLADEIYLSFGLPTIGDVSFSLNGQEYLIYPALGDFLKNGWALGEGMEKIGDWSEEEGPYNVVTTGYYLTSGGFQVSAYLNEQMARSGENPETCLLRSLSLLGDDAVESLQIDGHEIAGVTREQLVETLGEPYRLLEEDYSTVYYYSFAQRGIEMMVAYYKSGSGQTQISLSF